MNDLFGALLVGLLGAGHCIAMCGGVASAMTFSIDERKRNNFWATLPYLIFYNLGRITSYMVAGAIIGGSSAALFKLVGGKEALLYLRLLAGIMMILLALYISRLWQGLLTLEKGGSYLWRYLQPLAKKFLPLKNTLSAYPFGFVWGWLPCGLVYSTLSWAAASGSASSGMLIMGAFGLGTLPALITVGSFAQLLKKLLAAGWFRHGSALLLFVYGLQTIYVGLNQF